MDMYLFPLPHVVLYPGTVKPLNVFEPRYISMIHDSINKKIPIALGFVDEPGKTVSTLPGKEPEFVRPIAGYGFPLILEEREDGSLLVAVQGQGRAKIGMIQKSGKPYLIVNSEVLQEFDEVALSLQKELDRLKALLFSWVVRHVHDASQQRHFIESVKTPQEVVGCLASFVVRDSDMQQALLEESDINGKVGLLKRMVSSTDFSAA